VCGLLHDVSADTDCPPDPTASPDFGGEIAAIVGNVIALDSLRPNR